MDHQISHRFLLSTYCKNSEAMNGREKGVYPPFFLDHGFHLYTDSSRPWLIVVIPLSFCI